MSRLIARLLQPRQLIQVGVAHAGIAHARAAALLLLQQAVYLEPIGATAITGTALRHAHQQALAQSASLASRAILLVDDTIPVVLAAGDRCDVVVGAAKKRLKRRKDFESVQEFVFKC